MRIYICDICDKKLKSLDEFRQPRFCKHLPHIKEICKKCLSIVEKCHETLPDYVSTDGKTNTAIERIIFVEES